MKFKSNIELQSGLKDSSGVVGTLGQVLSSTVSGVSWITPSPGGVTSFNTRTGAVTLTSGDVTTALGYTPVPPTRTITINGVTQDLSANRTFTVTTPETDTLATVTARGAITTSDIFTPNNGGIFFNGLNTYGSGVFGRNFGQDLGLNAGGLERTRIFSSGNVFIGSSPTDAGYKLDVNGSSRFQGYLNSNSCFEKVFSDAIYFPNGVSNLAADIRLGNLSFWGYIEVEVNSSYNNQNSTGKLTKVFAVGTNPGNLIYTNESRVSDSMGTIPDNIAIGDFSWDGANSTYRIPISHIVPSGNAFIVKVRMFTSFGGASSVFNAMTISGQYTLTALPYQYPYYNGRLGIGASTPNEALDVRGNVRVSRVGVNDSGIIGFGNYLSESGYYDNAIYRSALSSPNTSGNLLHISSYEALVFTTQAGQIGTQAVRMFINGSNGNVGIGTIDPAAKLDVNGDIYSRPGFGIYANTFGPYSGNMTIALGGGGNNLIVSNGNVLIGTATDAGYKLDVNGTGRFSGNLTATAHGITKDSGFRGGLYSYKDIIGTGTDYGLTLFAESGTGNGNIYFCPGGSATKQMTITSGGRLLLGQTSDFGYLLQVNGTSYFQGAALFNQSVTATGFFNSSDIRLKNIISQDGDVIEFTWKDGRDNKTHVGYIAQEVQKVMPDAVNEGEDGMLSVNYIEVLVKKIQDLENRIKQLEK